MPHHNDEHDYFASQQGGLATEFTLFETNLNPGLFTPFKKKVFSEERCNLTTGNSLFIHRIIDMGLVPALMQFTIIPLKAQAAISSALSATSDALLAIRELIDGDLDAFKVTIHDGADNAVCTVLFAAQFVYELLFQTLALITRTLATSALAVGSGANHAASAVSQTAMACRDRLFASNNEDETKNQETVIHSLN